MKKGLTLILFILTLSASAQVTFQRIFDYGRPLFIEQQSDSGYIIVSKNSPNAYGVNIMRLDKSGDTLWTKFINIPGRVEAVCAGIDSGYVIAGSTFTGGTNDHAFYAKLTNSGIVEWTNRFEAANSLCTSIVTICKTSDNSYMAAGRYSCIGSFHGNTLMIKINTQGDTLWTRVGSSAPNQLFNIIQTPDGGMLIGGNKSSANLLSKVDNQGNPLWEHNYYVTGESRILLDMVATADGSILCAGILGSTSFTSGALTIFKVDSSGLLVWSKQINSLYGTFGYSIETRPDGGFYLFGTQLDTTVTTSGNMYLASMDSSGAMLWDRLYGFPTENDGYKIITTSDGGALLAGTHGSPEKLYLVKINSTGYSGCNELTPQTTLNTVVLSDTSYTITVSNPSLTEFPIAFTYESGKNYYDACSLIGIAETKLNSFNVFPNPANENITIQLDQNPTAKVSLRLFDITGKLIQKFEIGEQEHHLNLENVSDGIYFLKIAVDNRIYGTRKIMVNKAR